MKALVEFFLKRSLLVNLICLILIVWGGFLSQTMRREAFPNIKFDIVSVDTIYLGASPQEVEKLITNRIEESIREVDGIKEYRSSSIENRSSITITLDPDVEDSNRTVNDIRSAVDRTRDLPQEAEKPVVVEISTNISPVIEVSLATADPTISQAELQKQARVLQRVLEDLDGVARVTRDGWRKTEVLVSLHPRALFESSLSPEMVVGAIQGQNQSLPGGELEGDKRMNVRTVGSMETAPEIAQVPVRSNEVGMGLKVRDVATVTETLEDPLVVERARAMPAIRLTVLKREKADVIDVVDRVKGAVTEYEKSLKPGYKVEYANDISFYVRRRIGDLFSNGISGLVLVTIALLFFMGWRTTLMVSIGIPIAIAATFIFMEFMGVTLNLISLFGMILVLGVLVDDSIIVSENFYRHMEMGKTPFEAARDGTSELVAPILGSALTSCAAFAPMLFMTGIFGKFVYAIPLVIIIVILCSLFECFFLLPSHLYDINRNSQAKRNEIRSEGARFERFRRNFYEPILRKILKHKKKAVLAITGLLVVSIALQMLLGKFKLFPEDIDIVQVKVTGHVGSSLEETESFVRTIESVAMSLPKAELDTIASRVGIIQIDPSDPFTRRGKNYGQVLVFLTPANGRERETDTIINEIRKKVQEQIGPDKAVLQLDKVSGGPPVGKPIAIEITGDEFPTLVEVAEKYKNVASQVDGVHDVDDTYRQGTPDLRVRIREDLAARAGVNTLQVAQAVTTAFRGVIATKLRRSDEEVDVRVRFKKDARNSLDALRNLTVTNQMGNLVRVGALVRTEYADGIESIDHLGGRRLVSVTASIDEAKTSTLKATDEISEKAKDILRSYPGYSVRYGGENKDTEDSMATLGRSFLIAVLIIYVILTTIFRSLSLPFLILIAVPFGIIGVILAFLTHGQPLSFLSIMGIIGLSGVVINDTIVLIDFGNKLIEENPNLDPDEVALQAGSMRLRAVFLTGIVSLVGLFPSAYGLGGSDPFLVPMALAFAWGIFFSMGLTLLIVPVFLSSFIKARRKTLGFFKVKTDHPV